MGSNQIGELFFNIVGKFQAQAFNKLDNRIRKSNSALKGLGLTITGALGAISVGMIGNELINVAKHVDVVETRFRLTTGSIEGMNQKMKEAQKIAMTYGTDLRTTEDSMSGFLASTIGGELSLKDATTMYDNFAASIAGAKLPADQAAGALFGLQQMISKGKIQAQELRTQFGEKMPGGIKAFADVYFKELAPEKRMAAVDDALKAGTMTLDKLLDASKLLRQRFAKDIDKGLLGTTNRLNQLGTSFELLKRAVVESGFTDVLVDVAMKLTKLFMSNGAKKIAENLGKSLKIIYSLLNNIVKVIIKLTDLMKQLFVVLSPLLVGTLVVGIVSVVAALVQTVMQVNLLNIALSPVVAKIILISSNLYLIGLAIILLTDLLATLTVYFSGKDITEYHGIWLDLFQMIEKELPIVNDMLREATKIVVKMCEPLIFLKDIIVAIVNGVRQLKGLGDMKVSTDSMYNSSLMNPSVPKPRYRDISANSMQQTNYFQIENHGLNDPYSFGEQIGQTVPSAIGKETVKPANALQ